MKLINHLHFNNVRGDTCGGIAAGVVALSLAPAIGVSFSAMFVALFAHCSAALRHRYTARLAHLPSSWPTGGAETYDRRATGFRANQ
jgi:hypothetical protein